MLIRCEKTDQQGLLNRVFPDQQKSDVSSLFLAFYFQEADKRQDQEQAFEFSHKSFGEYLLARRLVNFVRDMTKRIADEAWDADTALKKWVELYGPRPVNDDLCDFIKDISDRETIETRNEWRKAILKLLFRASKRGMPMAQMELANFAEMERQNRNAIENLFGTHSALYDIGQPVFPFDTSGESSLVSFLMRVPNRYQNWFPVHRMFRGLDFSHSFFQRALLDGVDLQGENLRECEFLGSSLIWANFEGADLTGVHFQSVTYGWGDRPQMVEMVTDCRNANFRNATLCQTRWGNVELENANFEGADLTGAHITDAQLRQTIGEPRLMTNGKPPKRGWRTANSRKRRKTSGSDAGLNERP